MNSNKQPPMLAFKDRFPVETIRSAEHFSVNEILELGQSCREVLHAIITLEQLAAEKTDPGTNNIPPELNRIEQKLDFLTELLSKVILEQKGFPAIYDVEMSPERVVWQSGITLETGDHCLLKIYLSHKYPMPLTLPVEVTGPRSDNQFEGRILLSPEPVIEDLTRLIFIFHRRQIARNRSRTEQPDIARQNFDQ